MNTHSGKFRIICCLSLLNVFTLRSFCTNTYFNSRITVKIGRMDQAKLCVMRQGWFGATANGVQWTDISIHVLCKENRKYYGGRRPFWRQSRAKTTARRVNYLYETVCMRCKDIRTDCSSADWSWSEKKQFRYFARLNGEAHSTSHTERPPVSCPLFYTLSLLTIETFFPRTILGLIQSSLWNYFKTGKQSVSASYGHPAHHNRPQVHLWHTLTPTTSSPSLNSATAESGGMYGKWLASLQSLKTGSLNVRPHNTGHVKWSTGKAYRLQEEHKHTQRRHYVRTDSVHSVQRIHNKLDSKD